MLTDEQKKQIDNMNYVDRRRLAYNTDNVDILEYLSNYEDWFVRYDVVTNIHTPVRVLIKLSKDKNKYVRCRAIEQVKRKCINIDKHTTKGILE